MTEELLVFHCSPTLAGLKTGNMFSCRFERYESLIKEIFNLNRCFEIKGIRVLPLRIKDGMALIYIYRPSKLKADLLQEESRGLLREYGYDVFKPEKCIGKLINKLRNEKDFPHEIGLFLGYPPEDVLGFIKNGAKNAKYTGLWKVYSDVDRSQKTFLKYKKCTENNLKLLNCGKTLDLLATREK